MIKFKKILVLAVACMFLLCSQKGMAGTVSDVADKTIHYTARGMYYVTKYTLKTGWFVIKKTAKGVVIVSKSVFRATKDSFNSGAKPVGRSPDYYSQNTLPPPPPILE